MSKKKPCMPHVHYHCTNLLIQLQCTPETEPRGSGDLAKVWERAPARSHHPSGYHTVTPCSHPWGEARFNVFICCLGNSKLWTRIYPIVPGYPPAQQKDSINHSWKLFGQKVASIWTCALSLVTLPWIVLTTVSTVFTLEVFRVT